MIFSDFKFSFSLRHSLAVYAFSFVTSIAITTMQITVISDTHWLHDRIKSLNKPFINEVDGKGKMIIHEGDITEDGSEAEVRDFLR